MKKIILLASLLCCYSLTQAQLLKKLKDKVNKTINKDDDKRSDAASSGNDYDNSEKNGVAWCDTVKLDGAGSDGVSYTKIYSSPTPADIVYTECALGLNNDPMGYRLILSHRVNNKQEFLVVENGKVVDADTKVKPQYLTRETRSASPESSADDDIIKYVVADSTTHTIPKTKAQSTTIKEVDDDQAEMALNIFRQTDEYKQMTPEERKQVEETMKKGIAYNNSMAGKTINVGGQNGGSFSSITGYKVVIKGKTYGKFLMTPAVGVSSDESTFIAVGVDDKAAPVMFTQTKKTALDKNKYSGNSGRILKSPDHKKMVYIEPMQVDDKEMEAIATGKLKMSYNLLRPDGTGFLLNDIGGSGKFRLTNAGSIISVNETTGELYSDNKILGKFNLPSGAQVETDAIMIGSTPENIAYYDGSTGSLIYLDGSVKKLGIMYPSVSVQNGKTYMIWFRKCKNDFFIGKFSY